MTHVVYIAGPYRAANAWLVERNVRAAEALALEVAELGAVPLCPHTMTRHFEGTLTEQYWLDATLELMRRCDVVLLVPGWKQSEGTRGEVAEAVRLGLPVFRSLAEVREWVE